MRNRAGYIPGNNVQLTIVVPRALLDQIDQAARVLETTRDGVLIKGMQVLTVAAGVILSHHEHAPVK